LVCPSSTGVGLDAEAGGVGLEAMGSVAYGGRREIFTVAALRERADWTHRMKEER
jgi:hypothetical protein